MTITLSLPEIAELKPKITVLGVGGAGGNAVNNMIAENLEGVEFVVANTDAQSLANSSAERRIQLGIKVTKGLGAGSRPEVGRAAAEEAIDQIVEQLSGSHMVFITAGMGGGTGTGAAPVIARAARELGVLTVGVVTKPFQFEGAKRSKAADLGLEELQQSVDTLIVIPNQNLFRVATEKTTFADAFAMADNVLHSGVRGITDLMVMPGLINLDFSDVKTVIDEMGRAMMGTGEAEGEGRAIEAAETAISNPLLDETSMKGARGVLINITGGDDMTLFEVDEAANRIRSEVDPEANIIIGSTFDGSLNGKMRVTVFATGIDGGAIAGRPSAPVEKLAAIEDEIRHDLGGVSNQGEIDAGPDIADDSAAVEQAPPEPMTELMTGPRMDDALNGRETSESPEDEPPVDEEPLTRLVGSHRDAPFVAPAPMRADGAMSGPKEADPFAEAAVANGAAAEAPSRRGPTLLQRISLTKRGRQPEREAAEAVAAAKAKTEAAVPKLGEMDPADRIDQNLDLEDQLEIPAFLRRQAN